MKNIIMYTTDTWPHCTTAKSFLREKGYKFEMKHVDKDKEANEEFSKLGLRGVPSFVIGDEVIEGLDTNMIESLMDYKVINCPSCDVRLRLPKNKGKIAVTCPKCEEKFEQDTGSKK